MYNICVYIAILHTLYCGDSHDLGFDSIGVKKKAKVLEFCIHYYFCLKLLLLFRSFH